MTKKASIKKITFDFIKINNVSSSKDSTEKAME